MGGWGSLDEEDLDGPRLRSLENSLRLTDHMQELIERHMASGSVPVTAEMLCTMNGIAMSGLVESAGRFRDGPCRIVNSKHTPPSHTEVPRYVDEMCRQLASMRRDGHGVMWGAAYALWRVNWIHPFEDGNGRTARALSYLILAVGLELPHFPGKRSLLDRISAEKRKYWRCLEAADEVYGRNPRRRRRRSRINVTNLEAFLEKHLRALLKEATGPSE